MNEPVTHFKHFSKEKILESLVWIARRWEEVCPKRPLYSMYAYKILFYADKFHLNRYGIPITGDRYQVMAKGPVPETAKTMIENPQSSPLKKLEEKIAEAIHVEYKEHRIVTALRDPDLDVFADSNIQSLEKSLNKCKKLSAEELSNLTHKEEAWKNTKGRNIDYNLLVDEENPHREEILEALGEVAYYAAF